MTSQLHKGFKRRRRSWRAVAAFSIPVTIAILLTSYQLLIFVISHHPSVVVSPANSKIPKVSRHVSVWYPPTSCRGKWRTTVARDSPGGFPYALIRDAVVDRRPVATKILGQKDKPGTVRIVVYATTHLSARLSREGSEFSVDSPGLNTWVEYVSHTSAVIIPRVSGGYHPGLKTKYGQEVTEWQIGLRIWPEETADGVMGDINEAVKSMRKLSLNVTVIRYDEERFPLHAEFPIHCIAGWGPLVGNEGRVNACGRGADRTTGAILVSGSSLYGKKQQEREYYREVANFAARGLLGPLQFDAVAMTVTSNHSAEDMQLRCGDDLECHQRLEEANKDLLRNVAEVVEEELELIGVPRQLFSRIMIIPTCRFGSDGNGTEVGDACAQSKRYGQYHATYYPYTTLAPYYKWAVSYDMDEFIAEVPQISRPRPADGIDDFRPERPKMDWAQKILDDADESMEGPLGEMVFRWLNFRISSSGNQSRTLSTNLIRGTLPTLRHRDRPSESVWCYGKTRIPTGKSAVRCDVGLGFSIHHPILPREGERMEQRQSWRTFHGMRTWHPRLDQAHSSSCEYIPPATEGPR